MITPDCVVSRFLKLTWPAAEQSEMTGRPSIRQAGDCISAHSAASLAA
jgi:hypothetical protein